MTCFCQFTGLIKQKTLRLQLLLARLFLAGDSNALWMTLCVQLWQTLLRQAGFKLLAKTHS
jgi:hypothetical protein